MRWRILLFLALAVEISSPAAAPPTVVNQYPPAGTTVQALTAVEVLFSEPVEGVDASDFLVNGVPADEVLIGVSSQYKFLFAQPAVGGTVQISWAPDHGIHDLADPPNPFGGAGWTYILNTNLPPSVVINEFMAANQSGIRDEDGSYSDWIELLNAGTITANLDGWFLTDETTNLTKWRFPGVTLLPNSYLLVFASGKNRTNNLNALHTNFQLNKDGEFLALVDPQTNVVSQFYPKYPAQFTDVSYGRDLGDLNLLGYFITPTPRAPNSTKGPGFAPAVEFSRTGGTFTDPFALTLSTPDNPTAVIRYTLVNTATTAATTNLPGTNSPIYTGPINITNTMQVRARAFLPDTTFFPGPPRTESYLRLNPSLLNFTSDLPVIVIHTIGPTNAFPQGFPTPDLQAIVAVFDTKLGRCSLNQQPQLIHRVGINARGSSTVGYPKQAYAVEFWDEFNNDENVEVLGLPEESDWVLYAPNYFDRGLLHNSLAYELSNEVGRYASRTRFVEVFVNNVGGAVSANLDARGATMGNYWGVYVLEEKIKRNKNRVDVAALHPEETNAPAITGGYMLKIDRTDSNERSFTAGNQGIIWVYPDGIDMDTPQRAPQKSYVINYFNSFYTALTGPNSTDPVLGYAAWIDVDSWIDHNILGVMPLNADWLRLSGYFFKDRGKRIEMGPVWDFDRSQGTGDGANNDWRGFSPRCWDGGAPLGLGGTDYGTDFFNANNVFGNPWYLVLFKDPNFWQRWIDRYQELRQTVLSTNNLGSFIDSLADEVRRAQVREVARWSNNGASDTSPRRGNLFYPPGSGGLRSPYTNFFDGTFQAEVDFQKRWYFDRVDFIDTNFLNPPVLSSSGGMVSSGFNVTLLDASGKSGTILYYTTDGTDPRASGGAVAPGALAYGSAITITNNARLFVRAYNPNHRNLTNTTALPGPPISSPWSSPVAATYFVNVPSLRITEIMYHPAPPPPGNTNDADNFEYVEVKNVGSTPLNVNRFRIRGGIEFDFPNLLLSAGQSAVVVADPAAFQSRYGTNNPNILIAGQYTNRLNNGGERLILEGPVREPILDFKYSDEWYPITDGLGFSLVIVNENASPDTWGLKTSWRPSGILGGSPGQNDPAQPLFPVVVINEALTHTVPPAVDAIELYNSSTSPANISGWFLTDDFGTPLKYRIPANTIIPAGGFMVFTESQFNVGPNAFALSSKGDAIYLFSANGTNITGYVHGFDFGPQASGVTFGRYLISTGGDQFVTQISSTLGAANSGPSVGPVVISEIMYHPPDILVDTRTYNNSDDEFIELSNISDSQATLYDPNYPTNTWHLRNAVDFDFPPNVVLPPHGVLLVVSFDPTNTAALNDFRARNGVAGCVPVLGPFQGQLDNAGDNVELRRPDVPEPPGTPEAGSVSYILVERVKYSDDAPWPFAADGTGSSLQRLVLTAYGNDPSNWVAAAKTPGAAYGGGTAPAITTQPTDQTVVGYLNMTATFSVTATGSNPVRYQWQFNNTTLPNATNATLVLSNVVPSQAGQYRAIAYNGAGAIASSNATLNVRVPPGILRQPVSQTVRAGSNVTFVVVATSATPISYQWLFNGTPIPGATNPGLTINNVTNIHEGEYTVRLTDAVATVLSARATLKVLIVPYLLSPVPPLNISAAAGEPLTLGVQSVGTLPIWTRWRLFRTAGGGTILIDQTNNSPSAFFSFTVTTNSGGAYTVILTNAAGGSQSLAWTNAILTVLADSNTNGIPDVWEATYFGSPTGVTNRDDDFDGDGVSNWQEYISGTDPTDPSSYLKVRRISASSGAVIEFNAISNRTYSVQYKDGIDAALWTRLVDVLARRTNWSATVIDPVPSTNRYYRLATPKQP